MKASLIALAFVLLSPVAAFAYPLDARDLVGNYIMTGNNGFLELDVSFNDDSTSNFQQNTIDGTVILCGGVYTFDESTQDFISVYNCENGEIITHSMNFAGVTVDDLFDGITMDVTFETSLGGESSTLTVEIRKMN